MEQITGENVGLVRSHIRVPSYKSIYRTYYRRNLCYFFHWYSTCLVAAVVVTFLIPGTIAMVVFGLVNYFSQSICSADYDCNYDNEQLLWFIIPGGIIVGTILYILLTLICGCCCFAPFHKDYNKKWTKHKKLAKNEMGGIKSIRASNSEEVEDMKRTFVPQNCEEGKMNVLLEVVCSHVESGAYTTVHGTQGNTYSNVHHYRKDVVTHKESYSASLHNFSQVGSGSASLPPELSMDYICFVPTIRVSYSQHVIDKIGRIKSYLGKENSHRDTIVNVHVKYPEDEDIHSIFKTKDLLLYSEDENKVIHEPYQPLHRNFFKRGKKRRRKKKNSSKEEQQAMALALLVITFFILSLWLIVLFLPMGLLFVVLFWWTILIIYPFCSCATVSDGTTEDAQFTHFGLKYRFYHYDQEFIAGDIRMRLYDSSVDGSLQNVVTQRSEQHMISQRIPVFGEEITSIIRQQQPEQQEEDKINMVDEEEEIELQPRIMPIKNVREYIRSLSSEGFGDWIVRNFEFPERVEYSKKLRDEEIGGSEYLELASISKLEIKEVLGWKIGHIIRIESAIEKGIGIIGDAIDKPIVYVGGGDGKF